MTGTIDTVGVVGAGAMGSGIIEVVAKSGVSVVARDIDAAAVEAGQGRVVGSLDKAVERGKLQNLIFDNQSRASHRAMAAILGAILQLPAVKRSLARRQMRSRYLDRVLGITH